MPQNKKIPEGTHRQRISRFVAQAREKTVQKVQVTLKTTFVTNGNNHNNSSDDMQPAVDDRFNYVLLIVLYTLQGIPMGLSASIPFLLQEKITKLAAVAAAASGSSVIASSTEAARASYNANAIFALCSWPFSLKLLWAPIVDSCYMHRFGRRKSWLVPVQTLAGGIMMAGANFVEEQLGLGNDSNSSMNVRGVTGFFFVLYFLMATQDIAVDGWALTMLSKENRGKGPICNSIGQNIGYFLSFVGFLALNDVEASETLWRPLFRLPSNPAQGLVSLKSFLRFMGGCMVVTTLMVAVLKRELPPSSSKAAGAATTATTIIDTITSIPPFNSVSDTTDDDSDEELDAEKIGLKETYHRLWAVCQLPAVKWMFLILVTYRLPTALSDNVKPLKAVEYGLSKSTTALLSPTLILPLGILVPILAHKVWPKNPLKQFATAYSWRVTLVPLLDLLMLRRLRQRPNHSHDLAFWLTIMASTAAQAICNSLQFNAQMIFFASRVDPAIGGSYMTLLNTAANLGGTWPASFVMWLLSVLTPTARDSSTASSSSSSFGQDPYVGLQILFAVLGIAWILGLGPKLKALAALPDDAWRTHLLDANGETTINNNKYDLESGDVDVSGWNSTIATAKRE